MDTTKAEIDFDLPIIYEDENILAVNKPAGLAVHGDDFTTEPTVADWLLVKRPELRGVGEPLVTAKGKTVERPGLVHRLDKDTSGVLVVAKNQAAFLFLKQQFQHRTIHKTYLGLIYGRLKNKTGTINAPIGRSRQDPRRRLAGRGAVSRLREAVTNYEVIEEWGDYSLVEIKPLTGRTHQLRVHFKYLQHPIVCDRLYAPGQPCPEPLARQALHAQSLELTLPTGQPLKLEAALPADLAVALDHLRRSC